MRKILDSSEGTGEGPQRLAQLYLDLAKATPEPEVSIPPPKLQTAAQPFRLFDQQYTIKFPKQGSISSLIMQRIKYKQNRAAKKPQSGPMSNS
jgi:hypothetical protein